MRVLQSFTRERAAQQNFREVSDAYRVSNMQTVVLSGVYFPFVDFLSSAATAVVLGYGGWLAYHGEISIGVLVAFLGYLTNFFDPVQQLSQLYNTFLSAVAALDKITDLLDEAPEVVDAPAAVELGQIAGHVRLRRRSLRLRPRPRGAARRRARGARRHDGRARRAHGRRQVDDREAPRAFLRPHRGADHDRRHGSARRVAGRRCAASSGSSRRRASSSRARSSRTSRSAARTRRDEDVEAAARAVGADEFIERLEDGYETQLGERGSRLSLGQRQLIAFARALLADPRVLILDEATSSVDIGTERKIERALRRLLARPHRVHHRPPALDDPRRRPDRRARARPGRRAGHARRAAGRARPLHVALRRLVGGRGVSSGADADRSRRPRNASSSRSRRRPSARPG